MKPTEEQYNEAMKDCYGELVYKYCMKCGICGKWYGSDKEGSKECGACYRDKIRLVRLPQLVTTEI